MKLTIFDCDGVLIDSEIIACGVDAEELTEIGFKISTEDVVHRFSGMPSEAMYATIEAELGRPLPEDFTDRVKRRIEAAYRTDLRPIAGAAEVLGALRRPFCVASSSSPAKLALGLVETGLYELFYPHIFSTALVARGKPHPDLFLYAARAMGADPADCVVIEDSIAGVTAASRAGMRAIGFTGGSHCLPGHGDRLIAAGAASLVSNFRDLPGAFDEVGA